MSQTSSKSQLVEAFDHEEFEAMRESDIDEYRIQFEDSTPRRTGLTVLAYFARLDPEATVEPL